MIRFALGVLAVLGTAACDPYDAQVQRPSSGVSNDAAGTGVRISGYGRVGVSGRW